jgi:hypothetical protein
MKLKFKCQCGKILVADTAAAGKKAKCPNCGQMVQIPTTPQATASQSDATAATQNGPAEAKLRETKPPATQSPQAPAINPAPAAFLPPQPMLATPSASAKDLGPVPLDDFDSPTDENDSSQVKPSFSGMPFLKGRQEAGVSRSSKALPATSGEKTVQGESGTEEYGLLIEPDEVCPNCGRPMTKQAVLCINCGYNRKTGALLAGVRNPTNGKK